MLAPFSVIPSSAEARTSGRNSEDEGRSSITADEANTDHGEEDTDGPQPVLRRRRQTTLYDAVAGKAYVGKLLRNDQDLDLDQQGLLGQQDRRYPRSAKRKPLGHPLRPDEALFQRRYAPERFEEHDVYRANVRDLPDGGRGILPDTDILRSVHAYTSRYYGAMERRQRRQRETCRMPAVRPFNYPSMDESALLAFGILLEEAGREILGRRGDLVFTEAREPVGRTPTEVSHADVDSSGLKETNIKKGAKRRRLADPDEDLDDS